MKLSDRYGCQCPCPMVACDCPTLGEQIAEWTIEVAHLESADGPGIHTAPWCSHATALHEAQATLAHLQSQVR